MKLTKLPTDKNAEPIVDIVLPLLWLCAVHTAFILIGRYIPEERLQGFLFGISFLAITFVVYKTYKASMK